MPHSKPLPTFLEELDPSIYHSDNYVVLDFEIATNHGDFGSPVHPDNNLLTGSYIQHRRGAAQLIRSLWADELGWGSVVDNISNAAFLVAHNAKYELGWLKRCGLDLSQVLVFDTQIAEYVLCGNRAANAENQPPAISISLDSCCRRRGWKQKDPVVDSLIKGGVNPKDIPPKWLQDRCEQDVRDTERLFKHQLAELTRTNRLNVLFTRCILTPVLADIEFAGMHLDKNKLNEVYSEYEAKLAELERDMDKLSGGINWRSTKQLGEFLYDQLGFEEKRRRDGSADRTRSGRRKTDKRTLDYLVNRGGTTQEQRRFIALRKEIGKYGDALSKSLRFFKGVCEEFDCRFKAEFRQTQTATHRLASRGIPTKFKMFDGKPKSAQFQNLPNKFKSLFSASREGWLLAEVDGSQLEFRVAAFLGQDKTAMADIADGHDVHRFTASEILGIPENEVTYNQRKKAKARTFLPLYGGTSGTAAERRYNKAFKNRYPNIPKTQDRWVQEVLQTKRLITPWGLQYYWPWAKVSESGYVSVTSSVYNYPIQALATAEIIPIALTFLWHRLITQGLTEQVRLVNTVHDSVIAELHPEAIEEFRQISIQAFGTDVYHYLSKVYGLDFNVPLGVGITIGEHWTEGKEESYNIYRDGEIEVIK